MNPQYADKLIGKTMLKTFLFIILVMLMKPVIAASLMSHEKFVHLNYEDQREIVIATMKLVVAMESKYHHQVKNSGFDPERFRRYTEFMKNVSNLFFSEAHAAGSNNIRYGQFLEDLTAVLNDKDRDKCIYGGWISSMVSKKCTHPSESTFKRNYKKDAGCPEGRNKITCNPAIFGFKKVSETNPTLFCVDAGEGKADNSSLHCMMKALEINPYQNREQGASSKEDRIADMIQGIKRNPNDSNRMFDFLIKACACDASQSRQISAHYANYMRPHQTCYSILRMLSETVNKDACPIKTQILDPNQISFLEKINGSLSATQMASSDVASIYKQKMDEFMIQSDYQRICGPTPGPGPTDPGRCVNEKNTITQAVCCDEKPNRQIRADQLGCEDKPPGGITVTNDGPINTDIGTPGTDPGPTGTDPGTDPGPTGTDPGTDPGPTGTNPGTDPGPTGTTTTCNEPNKELVDNVCKTKCDANNEIRDPVSKECKPKPIACEKPEQVREGPENSCVDPCKANEERDSETHVCKTKPSTEDEAVTSVSITVTGKVKDTSTSTVTTTINPAETDWSLYTLIWFSRGETRATDQNVPGTRTTAPTPDISTPDPGTDAPEDNSRDLGDKESLINRDDSKSLDAPRLSNDYEMCARLVKKSDNSKADEKCAKIPKKPVQAPRPNGNPFGPQQMGPTRGGPSDAVFRGVR